MVGQGGLGWGSESLDLLSEELRAQYRSYRRRQARGLVRILPVEAVRPLYRMALNNVELDGSDPLEVLVQYCERILPLPPFEVWVADRSGYQAEHLRDMAERQPKCQPLSLQRRLRCVPSHMRAPFGWRTSEHFGTD